MGCIHVFLNTYSLTHPAEGFGSIARGPRRGCDSPKHLFQVVFGAYLLGSFCSQGVSIGDEPPEGEDGKVNWVPSSFVCIGRFRDISHQSNLLPMAPQ